MHHIPYPHKTIDVDQIPVRSGSHCGKWAWLREFILNDIVPDGPAHVFTMPNKREAVLAQASSQNYTSSRKGKSDSSKLPKPFKIGTTTRAVDGPQGAFEFIVWVYTP